MEWTREAPSELAALIADVDATGTLGTVADWIAGRAGMPAIAGVLRRFDLIAVPGDRDIGGDAFDFVALAKDALLWVITGPMPTDDGSGKCEFGVLIGLYAFPVDYPGRWAHVARLLLPQSESDVLVTTILAEMHSRAECDPFHVV